MVTYLARYVPDLSTKTTPLRELLIDKNEFVWGQTQEDAFKKLKYILSSEPVLKFYNPNSESKISADASKSGLGAVLLQKHDNWHPVAYASRALTGAETCYAQIEKEMLAITFACERFHQYIYGQTVQVETDHKPLVTVFKKSLSDCPLRIQRLMLRVQKYSLEVEYVPGKFMFTADALSRAYPKMSRQLDRTGESEVCVYVDFIVDNISVSDKRLEDIKTQTQKDEQLQILKEYILQGFPEHKTDCSRKVMEFWNVRDELSYADGIIFKGSKIVIPTALRKLMLKKIHVGHLGIEKCRRRARQVMYWPGLNQSISDMVQACSTCLQHRSKQASQPLQPHPVANYPWEKVGVDLCVVNGNNYLVMCDYYSNYPEACHLKSTTSQSVVNAMKYVFSGQGIPKEVFSDNGPQFSCSEFRVFAEEYDFHHNTSSPNFAQSNGQVEKCVGIVKHLLKKSASDGSDFHLGLLVYRSTPLESGKSPMELLNNGRKVRTNLPIAPKQLYSNRQSRYAYRKRKTAQKCKQKQYFDKKTRELPPLNKNDTVRIRNTNNTMWSKKGVVEDYVAPRSYKIKTEDGVLYRRNRKDILKSEGEIIHVDSDDDFEEKVNVSDEENVQIPNNANQCVLSPKMQISHDSTRSGRPVIKPKRLIEEI